MRQCTDVYKVFFHLRAKSRFSSTGFLLLIFSCWEKQSLGAGSCCGQQMTDQASVLLVAENNISLVPECTYSGLLPSVLVIRISGKESQYLSISRSQIELILREQGLLKTGTLSKHSENPSTCIWGKTVQADFKNDELICTLEYGGQWGSFLVLFLSVSMIC